MRRIISVLALSLTLVAVCVEDDSVNVYRPDRSGDHAKIAQHYHEGQYRNGYLDYEYGYDPDPWRGWPERDLRAVGHAGEWSYAAGYGDAAGGHSFSPEAHLKP